VYKRELGRGNQGAFTLGEGGGEYPLAKEALRLSYKKKEYHKRGGKRDVTSEEVSLGTRREKDAEFRRKGKKKEGGNPQKVEYSILKVEDMQRREAQGGKKKRKRSPAK